MVHSSGLPNKDLDKAQKALQQEVEIWDLLGKSLSALKDHSLPLIIIRLEKAPPMVTKGLRGR